MDKKYECVIIDDDKLDLLTTTSMVKKVSFLELTAVYSSAVSAIAAFEKKLPDIAFLDVDMPGMTGLEFRKQFAAIPACVFITSYPEYAVEGFELSALDFIVKPLKSDRFQKTAQRIQEYLATREKANLLDHTIGGDNIFIRDGHQELRIAMRDIVYLEALKDYTSIVTAQKKYCILSSLGNLLKQDHFNKFIRIHRSYAIQPHFIKKKSATEICMIDDTLLPVGRSFKEILGSLK